MASSSAIRAPITTAEVSSVITTTNPADFSATTTITPTTPAGYSATTVTTTKEGASLVTITTTGTHPADYLEITAVKIGAGSLETRIIKVVVCSVIIIAIITGITIIPEDFLAVQDPFLETTTIIITVEEITKLISEIKRQPLLKLLNLFSK